MPVPNKDKVIANFSASCSGPCRTVAPFHIDLSEKHPSIMFLVIDLDELTEFSTSRDLKATPTFCFLRNGQQFDRLEGANKPEHQPSFSFLFGMYSAGILLLQMAIPSLRSSS
ncbi:hypothetical protein MLD38_021535 [Melastoma candidum]|uniref:Uncharacterized protein n=1 Tax=Melastoma candidum TaxID=119954 RepID=A0ACB9QPI1_9MYRT|nr:hypothetical protein MLD38_021535 [Melastoma candidum]